MSTEIVEYSTLHSVHTDTHQNIMPYVLQATLQSLSPAFYRDKHQEKGVTVTSSNVPRLKKVICAKMWYKCIQNFTHTK